MIYSNNINISIISNVAYINNINEILYYDQYQLFRISQYSSIRGWRGRSRYYKLNRYDQQFNLYINVCKTSNPDNINRFDIT